jgi:FMN-dependent NADH-azoreductase
MPKILHLNASPRGPHSSSQRLAEAFLAQVGAGAEVETVKLFDAAMPAFAQAGAEGKLKVMAGMAPEDGEQAVLDAAQPLIDQLKGADKVVVSTGMWNFSVPYPLKHYIDLVV